MNLQIIYIYICIDPQFVDYIAGNQSTKCGWSTAILDHHTQFCGKSLHIQLEDHSVPLLLLVTDHSKWNKLAIKKRFRLLMVASHSRVFLFTQTLQRYGCCWFPCLLVPVWRCLFRGCPLDRFVKFGQIASPTISHGLVLGRAQLMTEGFYYSQLWLISTNQQ